MRPYPREAYAPGTAIGDWRPEDEGFVLVGPMLWLGFALQDPGTPYGEPGFSSAIAAYGFFSIPAMFAAMAVTSALWLFIGFYATCLAVCWWFYARRGAEAPSRPGPRGRAGAGAPVPWRHEQRPSLRPAARVRTRTRTRGERITGRVRGRAEAPAAARLRRPAGPAVRGRHRPRVG